jgi:molybdopterin molybdotransferase
VTGEGPPGPASWRAARELAGGLRRLATVTVALSAAAGLALAEDVAALTDLPAFAASAMDGWAFRGEPPWTIAPAGTPLLPGTASAITTGGAVPAGADAVLRIEDGEIQPDRGLLLACGRTPPVGADVRLRGSECVAGEVLARGGARATPAVLGLLAAAGHDSAAVVVPPVVDLLVLGDELLDRGPARDGLVRDALSLMLPPWLAAVGAEAPPARRVGDTAGALRDAISACSGDLVVTTGSTAGGPGDHLHAVLAAAGARLLIDSVLVRPGHPMLMAELADGRRLVGLPGNPLAAVSGLLTLVAPAVHALAGLAPAPARTTVLATAVKGHPRDVRLVPVSAGTVLHFVGPAMLRGLAAADALAVIPPGGAAADDTIEVLALPWTG